MADAHQPPGATRAAAEQHYYAAIDALASGDPPAAIAGFEAALAIDPALLEAMHGLVRALQEAGRYDEGIAAAYRLAALDPDDVLAHTALSILYQHKGMIPEAEAAATRAKLLGWKQQLRVGKTAEDRA